MGVVGALQYDVIASRLKSEYGVTVEIEPAGYAVARWLGNAAGSTLPPGGSSVVAVDRQQHRVLLFANEWEVQYFEKQNPSFGLLAESPVT